MRHAFGFKQQFRNQMPRKSWNVLRDIHFGRLDEADDASLLHVLTKRGLVSWRKAERGGGQWKLTKRGQIMLKRGPEGWRPKGWKGEGKTAPRA